MKILDKQKVDLLHFSFKSVDVGYFFVLNNQEAKRNK